MTEKHILNLGKVVISMAVTESKQEVTADISASRLLLLDEAPKFQDWKLGILDAYDNDPRPLRIGYPDMGIEFLLVGIGKSAALRGVKHG